MLSCISKKLGIERGFYLEARLRINKKTTPITVTDRPWLMFSEDCQSLQQLDRKSTLLSEQK